MMTLETLDLQAEEMRETARAFEPKLYSIPAWVVEEFEKQGGVFAGKKMLSDGSFTISGIERFTDNYFREAALCLIGY